MSLLFPLLMTTLSGIDDSAVLCPSETECYKSCFSPVLEPVGRVSISGVSNTVYKSPQRGCPALKPSSGYFFSLESLSPGERDALAQEEYVRSVGM